jgi:HEAT repeat protein
MYQSLEEAAANCARNIATGFGPIFSDRKNLGGAAVLMPPEPEHCFLAGFTEESTNDEHVAEIIYALKDSDGCVRASAVCALAKLFPPPKEAVPALLEALEDSDWVVRIAAIIALGELGGLASDAVPALIAELCQEDVCASAAIALGRIGPPAKNAHEALSALLNHQSDFVRWCAKEALKSINRGMG